jgi:hypothetical protein
MKCFDILLRKEQIDEFVHDLLWKWHKVLQQYEAKWTEVRESSPEENYLPYVYNEQAQTGLLAVAGKLINGFPFIEFNQDKYTCSGRGQQDLEIISADNKIWNIEAKYLEIKRATSNLRGILEKKMESAIYDVETLQNRKRGTNIAIVFFRPWGYETGSAHDDFIRDVQSLYKWSRRCDFLAYHLCQKKILNQPKHPHPDSPGIAILGKLVD